MFVLGILGSPREGNSASLLHEFMTIAQQLGSSCQTIQISQQDIKPCIEDAICEKSGICPIHDDMQAIYDLLQQADVVVVATPIFFYNVPAQLKALIDRSQMLWARKYRLKITDPMKPWRKSVLLALGATRGKNLFEGTLATMKYFFDAISATLAGNLTYREIEHPGDIEKHPTAIQEVKALAHDILTPFLERQKVVFVCQDNASLSQIAMAFTQRYAGNKIEAFSAGIDPSKKIHPMVLKVMKEKEIDIKFRKPQAIHDVLDSQVVNLIISMGHDVSFHQSYPHIKLISWDINAPNDIATDTIDEWKTIRNIIDQYVTNWLNNYKF